MTIGSCAMAERDCWDRRSNQISIQHARSCECWEVKDVDANDHLNSFLINHKFDVIETPSPTHNFNPSPSIIFSTPTNISRCLGLHPPPLLRCPIPTTSYVSFHKVLVPQTIMRKRLELDIYHTNPWISRTTCPFIDTAFPSSDTLLSGPKKWEAPTPRSLWLWLCA